MSGKFPLQPLLDLANTRMDEAARRLGELIASERSGQQKLEMLESYRAEYRERFIEATRAGIGPDELRNFSAFINRIDDAIAAQHQVVAQSRHYTTQGQKVWMAQRNKVRAFDTLSQRHQDEQAKLESRREQRTNDEHAARKHLERDAD
ncbi:flagellar export protein FliJ [Azoarcus sp. L1K30]|uniref:flagellar export protein FliJ n=1 Tax=Azoarcus sp. L1K30 TaxID=2820277 RepID=UPI001B83332A|nr:flagellar export protein FliJ [Azoarcus sp. L1K30]MBR0565919.1 flagellar export protein FliJ [Azoarcus sp. L1K30]